MVLTMRIGGMAWRNPELSIPLQRQAAAMER